MWMLIGSFAAGVVVGGIAMGFWWSRTIGGMFGR